MPLNKDIKPNWILQSVQVFFEKKKKIKLWFLIRDRQSKKSEHKS